MDAAPQAQAHQAPAIDERVAKRICLRLDNGSLIGHGEHLLGEGHSGVVVVSVDKAFEMNKLTSRHFEKLHRLEQIMVHLDKIREEAPLKAYWPLTRPETIAVGPLLRISSDISRLMD